VGDTQPSNPRAVPKKQLEAWAREGMIEWWGFRNDMPAILKQTTVVCLPTSYGEGVPKILLEAAASGRPIVASDLSGCKFAVRDGQNGILVPAKDAPSTAAALRRLLDDPDLMQIMGDKGRVLAEEEFSDHEIARQTVEAYDALAANATNRT
jgi:glycosyltransferase involved in cell wall biosynthesis